MAITSVSKDFIVKHGLVVNTTATILGTATSVSTSTGAIIVSGGVGIAGSVFAGNIFAANRGQVGFYDTTSSHSVSFRAVSTLTTSTIYTLPAVDGGQGNYLATDGSGNLTWETFGDIGYPPFPIGDYGDGEAYPTNGLFQDAFGVTLLRGYDCMGPAGNWIYEDFGTL